MAHPFLSDAWVDAARAIRERHVPDAAPIPAAVQINLVVNDSPFGDGPINSYVDTTSGSLVMELGQLDDPDVTVTTDYETAKSLFLATDPAAGMQAFMAGKLVVQGDMMKLVVLPTLAAIRPRRAQAAVGGDPRRSLRDVSVSRRCLTACRARRRARRPTRRRRSARCLGELPRAHPLHRAAANEERLPAEPARRRRQVGDDRRDVGRVPLVEHPVRARP